MTQLLVSILFPLKLSPNSRLSLDHKAKTLPPHICFSSSLAIKPLELFPWDSNLCHQDILIPLLFLSACFLPLTSVLSTRGKKSPGYASLLFPTLASPPPPLRAPGRCLVGDLCAPAAERRGTQKTRTALPSLLRSLPYSPSGSAPWRAEARGRRRRLRGDQRCSPRAPLPDPTFAHAPPTKAAPGRDPRPEKPKAHPQPGGRDRAHPTRRPPPPLPAPPLPNCRPGPSGRPRWPPAPPGAPAPPRRPLPRPPTRGKGPRPPGRPALTGCRSRRYRRRSRPSCSRRWGRAGRSRSTFGCAGDRSCPAASSGASPPASASRWPPWPRRRGRRPAGPGAGAGRRCAGGPRSHGPPWPRPPPSVSARRPRRTWPPRLDSTALGAARTLRSAG